MTGPEDSPGGTRPISVAELLAKTGTIGAPPVGGRRRRRRGNNEAVTVAELTGEIPIVTGDAHPIAAADLRGPPADLVGDHATERGDAFPDLPAQQLLAQRPLRRAVAAQLLQDPGQQGFRGQQT